MSKAEKSLGFFSSPRVHHPACIFVFFGVLFSGKTNVSAAPRDPLGRPRNRSRSGPPGSCLPSASPTFAGLTSQVEVYLFG